MTNLYYMVDTLLSSHEPEHFHNLLVLNFIQTDIQKFEMHVN